ncbi:MAG: nucleotidyltransferase domain-containing protein, partial [Pseudomonadota bacterium]
MSDESAIANAVHLRSAIEVAIEAGGASTDIGAVLRRHWRQAKAELFSAHTTRPDALPSRGAGGGISYGLSDVMDVIIRTLVPLVCDERVAVLATGGYGRGRLAPFSDIDLLVLVDGKDHQARLSPFLYALWDGGLPLSHSA